MPLSPSTSAVADAVRVTLMSGLGLTAPSFSRATYWGRRKTPWASAPTRSASTINAAHRAASAAGRPILTNASTIKLSMAATEVLLGVLAYMFRPWSKAEFSPERQGLLPCPLQEFRVGTRVRSRPSSPCRRDNRCREALDPPPLVQRGRQANHRSGRCCHRETVAQYGRVPVSALPSAPAVPSNHAANDLPDTARILRHAQDRS